MMVLSCIVAADFSPLEASLFSSPNFDSPDRPGSRAESRGIKQMDLKHYYMKNYDKSIHTLDELILHHVAIPEAVQKYQDSYFPFEGENVMVFPHYPHFSPYVILHSHTFFEFVYVYSGNCDITVDSVSFHMTEGDLCLFNLRALHTIKAETSSENIIFNLLVKHSQMDDAYFRLFALPKDEMISGFFLEAMQNKTIVDNYLLFRRDEGNAYEEMVHHIIREYYEQSLYKHEMYSLLLAALLIDLARLYKHNTMQKSESELPNAVFTEIITFIYDHCRDVSIATLSHRFNYSPSYLSNLIKKYYNSSFSDILQSARFQEAAKLLRTTTLPVCDVMEQIGCTNRTWFTKKFKERYGITPAEYRKKTETV